MPLERGSLGVSVAGGSLGGSPGGNSGGYQYFNVACFLCLFLIGPWSEGPSFI